MLNKYIVTISACVSLATLFIKCDTAVVDNENVRYEAQNKQCEKKRADYHTKIKAVLVEIEQQENLNRSDNQDLNACIKIKDQCLSDLKRCEKKYSDLHLNGCPGWASNPVEMQGYLRNLSGDAKIASTDAHCEVVQLERTFKALEEKLGRYKQKDKMQALMDCSTSLDSCQKGKTACEYDVETYCP